MNYPTIEEVNKASHKQLGQWCRFLKSPGYASADRGDSTDFFQIEMNREKIILDRIIERFKYFGGWNPKLSKEVGWNFEKETS